MNFCGSVRNQVEDEGGLHQQQDCPDRHHGQSQLYHFIDYEADDDDLCEEVGGDDGGEDVVCVFHQFN